jgi:hypothetical protein
VEEEEEEEEEQEQQQLRRRRRRRQQQQQQQQQQQIKQHRTTELIHPIYTDDGSLYSNTTAAIKKMFTAFCKYSKMADTPTISANDDIPETIVLHGLPFL